MSTRIRITRINDDTQREDALQVIEEVYHKEKQWIRSPEEEFGANMLKDTKISWVLARAGKRPVGLLRLSYDPPLELPDNYQVSLNRDIDLNKMAALYRFVDIGRFMIIPDFRRNIKIALRLMRAAIREVVERGYTHFITDVFENDPHSPLQFHTRILGFEVVGRHLHGELNCSSTRIILTLDIIKAWEKVRHRRNRIYRTLTYGIRRLLNKKLAARSATGA
jgi:hypothetical protein